MKINWKEAFGWFIGTGLLVMMLFFEQREQWVTSALCAATFLFGYGVKIEVEVDENGKPPTP